LMMIRRRKHPSISIDEPVETDTQLEEPKQIVDWCCMPETEMMSSEAQAYMDQAIEELPPSLRAVFLLRDIEGLSTEETSQALDLSIAAVKTRLSRARMRLRELLSGYFGERLAADQSLAHKEEA
jgi:RNA polymerase sigma-70 factor, ECF subfamily